jgi:AGCS family alanine or glycine:cation symporter
MELFSSFFSIIVLSGGLAQTVGLRAFQFKHLRKSIMTVLFASNANGKHCNKCSPSCRGTTPFEAMASALGGSIGTANIAGTASAVAIGGAGAVFYMWLAGVFGMALKFSEIVLSIKYREKRGGAYYGGPMSYIERGIGKGACHSPTLSKLAKLAAVSYAVFTLFSSALGTPLVQANTLARSAADMLVAFDLRFSDTAVFAAAGAVCAALTGIVVIGGVKRIGRVSALIVPFMALTYIGVCLAVLIKFRTNLLSSIGRIFSEAFGFRALGGGFCGVCVAKAVRTGISRGVYSNEAGVGSSAMAHASAQTDSAVRQGLFGIFEVFADTLIMCSLTALVVLSSGVSLPSDPTVSGSSIALSAFSSVLGEKAASVFLSASLLLFAYTSIIGWSVYGLSAAKYLFGEKAKKPFCIAFTLLTALGAFVRVDIAWKCGELFSFLMAAPNVVALLLLSKEVKKEIGFFE